MNKSQAKELQHRSEDGELQPERVWKELSRALMEAHPRLFFDTLLECDALHVLFPEVYRLKTALEARRWHPEGDAYEHTMLVLQQGAQMAPVDRLDIMLACLVHDFGKGLTPRDQLPKHYGHDVKGVPVVEEFCNRLTVPAKMRDAAMAATRYHMYMHKLRELNSKTFVKMFDDMGAKNDPRKVTVLYWVGICDHRGRLGSENENPSHLGYLLNVWQAVQSVRFADVFPNGETSVQKIKDGLFRAKVQAVAKVA
jgi:tRNA nucleotidyltransferase (CCA-adding enzyme)